MTDIVIDLKMLNILVNLIDYLVFPLKFRLWPLQLHHFWFQRKLNPKLTQQMQKLLH